MAQSGRTDMELLTEHFGAPPVSLLDDIINTMNILAENALTSIEQFLLSSKPKALGFRDSKKNASSSQQHGTAAPPTTAEEAAKFEIDNGTHQLETLLCSRIDQNFDKFELYIMRNILIVRPEDQAWIRLRHYEGLDFGRAARQQQQQNQEQGQGQQGPTVESVNDLWKKLRASQKLNLLLKVERAKNEALLNKLRGLVGAAQDDVKPEKSSSSQDRPVRTEPLAFLRDAGSLTEGDARNPVQTTTAFALSQLQALRALSGSLQSVRADLAPSVPEEDEDERDGRSGGWRGERADYVEKLTRKHLENVRGLELGGQGEVRDGDWQGGGRNIGREEVEGLERVAGMLGVQKGDEMDES